MTSMPARDSVALRVPPGNRLEALKGDRSGFSSVRINDQYRITFRFEQGNANDVCCQDYHEGAIDRSVARAAHASG